MDFDKKIDKDKTLVSLRNRVWKLLPIFEGKDKSGNIVFVPDKAYKNYLKNLQKISTEVWGANEILFQDERFVQLLCLLQGLENTTVEDHAKIKTIITHCTDLCEKMRVKDGD
jgi:hypothetical protein